MFDSIMIGAQIDRIAHENGLDYCDHAPRISSDLEVLYLYSFRPHKLVFAGYYTEKYDPFFEHEVTKLVNRQAELGEKYHEAGLSLDEFLEFNKLTMDINLLFA